MKKSKGHDCQEQRCSYRAMTVDELLRALSNLPREHLVWVVTHSSKGYGVGGYVSEVRVTNTLGLGQHVQILADVAEMEGLD